MSDSINSVSELSEALRHWKELGLELSRTSHPAVVAGSEAYFALLKLFARMEAGPATPATRPTPSETRPLGERRSARKAGRPRQYDPAADRRIAEAWATGSYASYKDMAKDWNLQAKALRLAVERHKKRAKRSRE